MTGAIKLEVGGIPTEPTPTSKSLPVERADHRFLSARPLESFRRIRVRENPATLTTIPVFKTEIVPLLWKFRSHAGIREYTTVL
jgi:hypothetical protein